MEVPSRPFLKEKGKYERLNREKKVNVVRKLTVVVRLYIILNLIFCYFL